MLNTNIFNGVSDNEQLLGKELCAISGIKSSYIFIVKI